MKRIILSSLSFIVLVSGILIVIGFFDPIINNWAVEKLGRYPGNRSILLFRSVGFAFILISIVITILSFSKDRIKTAYHLKVIPFFNAIDLELEKFFSRIIDYSKKTLR